MKLKSVKSVKSVMVVMALVAAVGLATDVFAGKGYGRGYGGADGGERGRGCPGYGDQGYPSEEDAAGLDAERRVFLDATADLRRSIRQKDLALRSELAKETVDSAKAMQIQKELSALHAQMDEKRLEHRLNMQAAHPDWQGGPGPRGQRMWGRGGCW
jgi:hypothetical protein